MTTDTKLLRYIKDYAVQMFDSDIGIWKNVLTRGTAKEAFDFVQARKHLDQKFRVIERIDSNMIVEPPDTFSVFCREKGGEPDDEWTMLESGLPYDEAYDRLVCYILAEKHSDFSYYYEMRKDD